MWIENKKSYRIRQCVCVILGICVSLFWMTVIWNRQDVVAEKQSANAQEKLADEVFRFHVLANSDSEPDQNLKLKIRDGVLSYMKEYISGKERTTVKEWAKEHLAEIEQEALKIIYAEGYSYPVKASVVECYFPERRYGDVRFPKGYYEALRVEIGKAVGHNWWCVIYPSLCFMDATCAVVTEEGEEELEKVLDKETYETVTATSTNFKIKSFFYEMFQGKSEINGGTE